MPFGLSEKSRNTQSPALRGAPVPRRIFMMFLAIVLTQTVFARVAFSGEVFRLGIKDAFKMAIESHESLKIANEALSQSQSTIDKATSAMLPTITAEGGFTRYDKSESSGSFVTQPDDSTKIELKISQSLYSGGKEWSARRQASLGLLKTRQAYEEARQEVVLNVARAFYGALKTEKEMDIKKAALLRAEERKKVADARFRAGVATRSAVLRAEAEAAGASAALIKATSAVKDAKNALKRLIGVDADVGLNEPDEEYSVPAEVEGFIKTALSNRKDFLESQIDLDIYSEGVRYAWGGFLPTLKIDGVYSLRSQNPETAFFQEDSASATLTLSYPIFEGGLRRAELQEARSKLREAELKKVQLQRDIEVEVRQAFNNVDAFRAALESYKRQFSFAEEDYKMVFEQFKQGISTTVDVIDSDSSLISAQRSFMNAGYDLNLAIIELKYYSGMLMEGLP